MSSLSRRRVRAVLACVAALLLAPAVAHADTFESTGPGLSGLWSDPDTWTNLSTSGPGVPGPSDTAIVKSGSALSLTADVSVQGLTLEGSGSLDLSTFKLASAGDVALEGDQNATSSLSSLGGTGLLEVAGKLLVENTGVTRVDVTVTGSLEFSGPLPGDPEASSSWTDSTLTQTAGTATFAGHKLNGALDPVLDGVWVSITGVNDFSGRQLTLAGSGAWAFHPTALSGTVGPALLTLGSLVVSGTHQASVDWSGISGPAGGDRVNLVAVSQGDTEDLIASSTSDTNFDRPVTGELLYASYIGAPRPVADPKPSVSSSSALAGHALPGDTITCAPGTWTPDGTKVYSWASDGTPIGGATASTFTVTSNELGTDVMCTVAVTSVDNVTGTEDSGNAVHVDIAPGNILEPDVTPATAEVGDVLTCDEGLWSSVNTPTYTYAWQRDGTPIAGAAERTYTTVGADNTSEITCSVVAIEGLASSSPVVSAGSAAIDSTPVATQAPSATSTRTPSNLAATGDVLTCAPGTWTPDGTKAFAWKRDNAPISGATAATYTVEPADAGTAITCSVTVTAYGASATEDSATVSIVTAPASTTVPSISGLTLAPRTLVGTALTCEPGTWTESPAFEYVWKRGSATVATTSTYTTVAADAGTELICTVTGTANGVSSTAAAGAVTVVPVPENTAPPAIDGSGAVGQELTCSAGTWAGSPDLTYEWLRGETVAASGSNAYKVTEADRGAKLRCRVTASVLGVSRAATSAPVAARVVSPPTVSIINSTDFAWRAMLVLDEVTLRFAVSDGAMVACTLDGVPISCTRDGARFLLPPGNSWTRVFEVVATDANGSTSARQEFTVPLMSAAVPRAVSVAAGATVLVPTAVFLGVYVDGSTGRTYPAATISSKLPVQVAGESATRASWQLRVTAPKQTGTYAVDVNSPLLGASSMTVNVFEPSAVTTNRQLGGVTDEKAPLTCDPGSPGSFYSWYVNDKLVRTDASNEFPAASVPKNGIVSCAVNDPVKGFTPPVKVLVFDGTRAAATTAAKGVSLAASGPTTADIAYAVVVPTGKAAAAKVRPKKARYTTLHTATVKLRQGTNKISFGRKLPKKGFKITVKLKKGKRYSQPLVLSKR